MMVPEASIDEYTQFPLRKNKIGRSWKVVPVKSISKPETVGYMSYAHLGACVFSWNVAHDI